MDIVAKLKAAIEERDFTAFELATMAGNPEYALISGALIGFAVGCDASKAILQDLLTKQVSDIINGIKKQDSGTDRGA